MPGYLDQYGAGEERRNRIIIRSLVGLVTAVVIAGLSWYVLKNRHQESVVKTFLDALRRHDYQAAYRDWGCTAEKPCTGYSFEKFLGDWGTGASGSSDAP
ncbi:MAG TPA: hypothetical protein VHB50_10375, partial [Bryobacteraceae bacterium]|nr:hypothetical protein [Bryobacteraceae bacterium]